MDSYSTNPNTQTGFVGAFVRLVISDTFSSVENLIGANCDELLNGDHGRIMLKGGGVDTLRANNGLGPFVVRRGFGGNTVQDYKDGSEQLDLTRHDDGTDVGNLTGITRGTDAQISARDLIFRRPEVGHRPLTERRSRRDS